MQQGAQHRFFMYDSLSRLIRAKNPEQAAHPVISNITDPVTGNNQWSMSYNYDENSNLKTRIDARNISTIYNYDNLNRATTVRYSEATPGIDRYYDGTGVSGGVLNSKGGLTRVSSSVSSTSYDEFDAMGRVKRHTQSTDGQAYTMSYGYDLAGNLTQQTYPSGRVVITEYDDAGRITGVRKQAGSYYAGASPGDATNRVQYTAHGAVQALRLGNGLWEHTNFNARLQPTQIGLGTSSVDASKLQLDYAYGATTNNGNVVSQTMSVPGLTLAQSYTYDAVNRLEVAQEQGGANWRQRFIYDQFGNRSFDASQTTLPQPLTNPEINLADNRLQGYGYDSAGNVTVDASGNTFAYDGENKQTNYNTGQATYGYDGDGRRVKKVEGGTVTTLFLYNAVGQMVSEYSVNAPPGMPTCLTTGSCCADTTRR